MIPNNKKIKSEIKKMQVYSDLDKGNVVCSRMVYAMSELLRWAIEDTVGWENPLQQALSHSKILNDEIKTLEKNK